MVSSTHSAVADLAAMAEIRDGPPIRTCHTQTIHAAKAWNIFYNVPHVTRGARFYTGSLAPQHTFHDRVPGLLASPSAPCRSPDRVAALHYRAPHPVTGLLPLAAPSHSLPDCGPRARP